MSQIKRHINRRSFLELGSKNGVVGSIVQDSRRFVQLERRDVTVVFVGAVTHNIHIEPTNFASLIAPRGPNTGIEISSTATYFEVVHRRGVEAQEWHHPARYRTS
jgi:hypothetical protein